MFWCCPQPHYYVYFSLHVVSQIMSLNYPQGLHLPCCDFWIFIYLQKLHLGSSVLNSSTFSFVFFLTKNIEIWLNPFGIVLLMPTNNHEWNFSVVFIVIWKIRMLKHAIWGGGGYNLSTFYDFVLGSTYFVHICLGYEDLMKKIRLSTGS